MNQIFQDDSMPFPSLFLLQFLISYTFKSVFCVLYHDNTQEPHRDQGAIKIPIDSMNNLVEQETCEGRRATFPFFSSFAVPFIRAKLAVTLGLDVHIREQVSRCPRHTAHAVQFVFMKKNTICKGRSYR